jgi:ribosomal 30S subunit maturation factor RimM
VNSATNTTAFGKVLKTFGANGELLVKIEKPHKTEEPAFIVIDGTRVPFYFKTFETRGAKAIVVFDNMESEMLAAELVGKELFDDSNTPASDTPDNEWAQIAGFTVNDAKRGVLGQVLKVHDYPGNPCAEIVNPDGQILMLPLNGILDLNLRRKTILTDIPDGLIELNH